MQLSTTYPDHHPETGEYPSGGKKTLKKWSCFLKNNKVFFLFSDEVDTWRSKKPQTGKEAEGKYQTRVLLIFQPLTVYRKP